MPAFRPAGILDGSMVSLAGVSKRYGSQVVLAGRGLERARSARASGSPVPNGAGKSTLLKILAGELEPDAGTVAVPRGARVGYLPQHILGARRDQRARPRARRRSPTCTPWRSAAPSSSTSSPPSTRRPTTYATIMDRYMAVCEEWDHRGPLRHRVRDRDRAARARVRPTATSTATSARSRAAGRCASRSPSCCCAGPTCCCSTSRPTTSTSRRAPGSRSSWPRYPGTVILVAHDRYFLDVAVNRITEVLRGKLTDYPMNYSRYLEEREKRLEQARAAYENQQEEIERIEAFIRRFRYQASKAALVQSRIKQLEKLERLPPPDGHERVLKIRLPEAPRSGRDRARRSTGAHKRYGDLAVYDGIDLADRARARASRWSARTAPASRRSSRCSPASSRSTAATRTRRPQRPHRLLRAGPRRVARPASAPCSTR